MIARRVRELGVYGRILPHNSSPADLEADGSLRGIVLSGGPGSVYDGAGPRCDEAIFRMNLPILGVCYGMQIGCQHLGGKVSAAPLREYGGTILKRERSHDLFEGLDDSFEVWMSHGDQVAELTGDFEVLASSDNCPLAAVRHRQSEFYGIQFHPEVSHTPQGMEILQNFLFRICRCKGGWEMGRFIEDTVAALKSEIGDSGVVLGLSGGVDSSVAALLLAKAIGSQLHAIFVDNGLIRTGERDEVEEAFRDRFSLQFHLVDARDRFLTELAGVTDPEKKRKTIGRVFIEVFEDEAKKLPGIEFLAQGTLYPDVIESTSPLGGPSATIKSHHNVGGLPDVLNLRLIEPLKDLFKDEVRKIARELGLPPAIVERHPFPGPGLAVRVIGDVTEERLRILRDADFIVTEEVRAAGVYDDVWQAFAVLLPVSTVGVMGDQRTYENVIALRAVESEDGMTADWARLPYPLLAKLSNRIINEVRGVNRVVYDISSKPPSTIEWE
ncbi:MAG: glutamine-hydrolyzing GMP synthase [Planctomycetota bacterium]|nr:glutamine-hydrolyzing GMP synthase [Planctomycetota bacterium]